MDSHVVMKRGGIQDHGSSSLESMVISFIKGIWRMMDTLQFSFLVFLIRCYNCSILPNRGFSGVVLFFG